MIVDFGEFGEEEDDLEDTRGGQQADFLSNRETGDDRSDGEAAQQCEIHRPLLSIAGDYSAAMIEDSDSSDDLYDVGDTVGTHQDRNGRHQGVDEDAIDAFLHDSVNAITAHHNDYGEVVNASSSVEMTQQQQQEEERRRIGQHGGFLPTQQQHQQNRPVDESAQQNRETDRRRAIQAIMRDVSFTEKEKRARMQQVMDGRRLSSLFNRIEQQSSLANTSQNGAGRARQSQTDHSSNGGSIMSKHDGLTINAVPECHHYERRCNFITPCCNRVFGCRLCHDDAIQDHGPLDRTTVQEIICKACNQRQNVKTNTCIRCHISFGEYHCLHCNLWMAATSQPFHCVQCGICRVGGRDKFFHCDKCCMCLSTTAYAAHKCIKEKFKNNCPVCQENLFASRQAPQDLPCGHAIHSQCFRTLASFDYRCPVCKKTIVSQATMASAWSARAQEIAVQPMPPDLVRVVSIICNDCGERKSNLWWHFLGVQCPFCASFNTVVDNMSTVTPTMQQNGSPIHEGSTR